MIINRPKYEYKEACIKASKAFEELCNSFSKLRENQLQKPKSEYHN